MDQVTVIGGGLAGLVAACEAAEAGAPVRLLEARRQLGGRAKSLTGPYAANHGPHALYAGTEMWRWLRARGLHRPTRRPGTADTVARIRYRWAGRVRRVPPAALRPVLRLMVRRAPVDRDLRSWADELAGEDAARALAGAAAALTFDHDPGRLSAAFVMDRVRLVGRIPNPARYVVGGWSALVGRVADHARALGVAIETGAGVDSLDDVAADGPVVVAVAPAAARKLLGDDSLRPECPAVALVDLGLTSRPGDPYIVFDLDEVAFVDRFTGVVPSLAPAGHELVQAHLGVRPGEGLGAAVGRVERTLDAAVDGWRDRVTWRRCGLVTEATGAVDLPGTTWRDRTPVRYADGVWLAGDWVAAPGHLSEVSCTSAVEAARQAVAAATRARHRAGTPV